MASRSEKLHARLQADPNDVDAFRALEEQYFHGKAWADLVKLYVQRANAMNSTAKAVKILTKAADLCARRLNKPEQAMELLERAYKRDRSDPKLKNRLIESFRAAGAHDRVAELLQAELQAAPAAKRPQIAMEVADAWRKAGSPAQAVGVLEQIIEHAPDSVGLHAALVEALEAMDAGPELLAPNCSVATRGGPTRSTRPRSRPTARPARWRGCGGVRRRMRASGCRTTGAHSSAGSGRARRPPPTGTCCRR
ncbi:MAG: tetratricopeptide repeat protein [Planctomycetota bacterium]|jgi:tetratricopeptide (TPR) repeat protein